MSAITTLPDHFRPEFETNWIHKYQTKKSKLKDLVTPKNFTAESMRCNLINPDGEPTEVEVRAGATNVTDLGSEVRWMDTKIWELTHRIDEWDNEMLDDIAGPESEVIKAMMMGFERKIDDRIIASTEATAITGKDRDGTAAFDTSNQSIAVDYVESGSTADSNMTLGKMRAVIEKMMTNEVYGQDVDSEDTGIVMAVSPSMITSMLRQDEIINSDYAGQLHALLHGEVKTFLGMRFRVTTRLPIDSNNVRTAYAWVKSGMRFSDGNLRLDVDVLPTESHAIQIRARGRNGGLRMQEKSVIRIFCDEDL